MSRYTIQTRKARKSLATVRLQRERHIGLALIIGAALAFAGLIYGAAQLDTAQGVTVSQSLDSAGL